MRGKKIVKNMSYINIGCFHYIPFHFVIHVGGAGLAQLKEVAIAYAFLLKENRPIVNFRIPKGTSKLIFRSMLNSLVVVVRFGC